VLLRICLRRKFSAANGEKLSLIINKKSAEYFNGKVDK
jgi:hypothetical protein